MSDPGRVEKIQIALVQCSKVEGDWLVSDTEQILASRMSAGRIGGSGKFPERLSVDYSRDNLNFCRRGWQGGRRGEGGL